MLLTCIVYLSNITTTGRPNVILIGKNDNVLIMSHVHWFIDWLNKPLQYPREKYLKIKGSNNNVCQLSDRVMMYRDR